MSYYFKIWPYFVVSSKYDHFDILVNYSVTLGALVLSQALNKVNMHVFYNFSDYSILITLITILLCMLSFFPTIVRFQCLNPLISLCLNAQRVLELFCSKRVISFTIIISVTIVLPFTTCRYAKWQSSVKWKMRQCRKL